MITNGRDLKATQERIESFQCWLVNMRRTARREEFEAAAGGYHLEIERMQAEVMEFLLHPSTAERS